MPYNALQCLTMPYNALHTKKKKHEYFEVLTPGPSPSALRSPEIQLPTESYWVLLSPTESYWVLLSPAESCWVLLYWVLVSPSESYSIDTLATDLPPSAHHQLQARVPAKRYRRYGSILWSGPAQSSFSYKICHLRPRNQEISTSLWNECHPNIDISNSSGNLPTSQTFLQ